MTKQIRTAEELLAKANELRERGGNMNFTPAENAQYEKDSMDFLMGMSEEEQDLLYNAIQAQEAAKMAAIQERETYDPAWVLSEYQRLAKIARDALRHSFAVGQNEEDKIAFVNGMMDLTNFQESLKECESEALQCTLRDLARKELENLGLSPEDAKELFGALEK